MNRKFSFFSFIVSLFFVSLLFSIQLKAADIAPVFRQLKDSGADYVPIGAVCEQVARLELGREFPQAQYDITTGIIYSNSQRVIGELDVVVFKKADERAVLVAEVKCWRNLQRGHKKASEQRARFLHTLESGQPIDLYLSTKREIIYERDQFNKLPSFISISQKSGTPAGFDRSLDYSLEELMKLRDLLLACQKSGECRRPD
jgi:hypothetical protein